MVDEPGGPHSGHPRPAPSPTCRRCAEAGRAPPPPDRDVSGNNLDPVTRRRAAGRSCLPAAPSSARASPDRRGTPKRSRGTPRSGPRARRRLLSRPHPSPLPFGLAFERLEPRVPELLEERPQLGEPLGTGTVQAPRAVASFVHEPGLLQHRQMLRDRWTCDVEVRRDLTRGELVVANEPQDRPAARRRNRFQRGLHGEICKQILTLEAT